MLLDVSQVTPSQSRAQSSTAAVLRPGESLTVTVKQVSQQNLSSGVFRLQVEANQQMLELSTKQPIATGSQITLSRDQAGQYSIQVNGQASSAAQTGTPSAQNAPQNTQQSTQPNTSNAQTNAASSAGAPQTVQNSLPDAGRTLTVPAKWVSPQASTTPNGQATNVPLQTGSSAPSSPTTPPSQALLSAQAAGQLIPEGQSIKAQVVQQIAQATPQAATSSAPAPTASSSTVSAPVTSTQPQGTPSAPPTPAQATSGSLVNTAQTTTPTITPTTTPTPTQTPTSQATAPQGTGVQSTAASTTTNPTQPIKVPSATTTSQPNAAQSPVQQGASTPTLLNNKAIHAYGGQSNAPTNASSTTTATQANGTLLTVQLQNQRAQLVTPVPLPTLTEVTLKQDNGQLSVQFTANNTLAATRSESPNALQATPPLTQPQQAAVDQALKQALPLQQPLADNLQTLSQLTGQSGSQSNVDKALQSLLNAFGVTPGGQGSEANIRNNVQMGGMFTEARLAQQLPVQGDMKQFLGQLQTLSESLPANQQAMLQKAIDSMSARITQQQIAHVQHRQDRVDTGERFFQLDLPVRFQEAFENVEMRIQQREAQNETGEWSTLWRVRLHFDLGQEGQMDADISLNQQAHSLQALFACSSDHTAQTVRARLTGFDQQLKILGFEETQLTCRQGNLARQTQTINKQLIDVKT
jgi:hypothetical protein